MPLEFKLDCPKEKIAATYYTLDNLQRYSRLTIDGLTGCMGLICTMEMGRGAALLVHDATDGYPHAKRKLDAFVTAHAAHKAQMRIVWTAGHLEWGHVAWFGRHLPGAQIDQAGTGIHGRTAISLDVTSEEPTSAQRDGMEIPRQSTGLRVLKDTDPEWQPDAHAVACTICNGAFTTFFRRHHCRNCGRVVCGNCCEKSSCLGRRFNHLSVSVHLYCTICVPPETPSLIW